MYDYLIVGAGLSGATLAHEITKKGKSCLVIEKNAHVAGHIYTKKIEDIDVHVYGAHIFHTPKQDIWQYMQQFAEFNHYINSPIANYRGELYNLPFNMNTFHQMWGISTPNEAKAIIAQQKEEIKKEISNLEEQAISLVGKDIYLKLIKEYTEKQWGRDCKDLPSFIIKRLPVRFRYDNNYFDDPYQGIPIEGYTKMVEVMLKDIKVQLSTDYLEDKTYWDSQAKHVLYTGAIDAYFSYQLGPLEYRSLRFETQILDMENYQGVAVMNFTGHEVPYTRILEHKHFTFENSNKTVISKEFPMEWELGKEAYYPINDEKNASLFSKYQSLAEQEEHTTFIGRLAEYRYYDMWQVVDNALKLAKNL